MNRFERLNRVRRDEIRRQESRSINHVGMSAKPTTGIHLLRAVSHSYSVPSSVSRIYLSSSFENDTLLSESNAEGECGKPDGCWPSSDAVGSAMTVGGNGVVG